MVQLVEVKISGNMEIGLNIDVEIKTDIEKELRGNLPLNPELANHTRNLWQQYRSFVAPSSRRPKKGGKIENPNYPQEILKSAEELEKQFNSWLKSDQFERINAQLRTLLNVSEEIRILVRTEEQDLQKMPWEQWAILKEFPHAEIAWSPVESVSQPPSKNVWTNKVRILAILGHKEGINTEKDEEILKSLPHAEVKFLVEPDKKEINDQLWEQNWDIIFFAGHSETENDIGRIYINSKEDISENSLTTDELWIGLKKAVDNGLQLAIFNSCDGLGLCKKIGDGMIPQMIVMRELVPDQVAQEFLKYFLQEYSKGKSLYLAVKEAKERLKFLENEFPCANWLPIIFQHPQITPPKWDDLRRKSFWEYLYLLLRYKYKLGLGILGIVGIISGYLILPTQISNYYNQQGLESLKQGNQKNALTFFNIALKIEPNNTEAKTQISDYFNQKGLEEIRKGDNTEAIKSFDLSLKFNPNNTEAKGNKSYIYVQNNTLDPAIESWEKGKDPENPSLCNNAGFAYYKRGNYERAKNLLSETCLVIMKKTGDKRGIYKVLKNIGLVLIKTGEYQEADKYSRQAINLGIGPKEGVANCLLAESLEKQNIQNQETLYHWRYCLKNAHSEFPEEQKLREKAEGQIPLLKQKLLGEKQ